MVGENVAVPSHGGCNNDCSNNGGLVKVMMGMMT